MIAGLIQVLTQFFFFFAAFIMLPVTVVSLIYGKLVGQIHFRVKEGPSLFEQKKPNPSVKGKMRWEEEQRKLFRVEEAASSSSTPNKELSAKDFGPTGELREERAEEQSTEEETETETEEETREEETEKSVFTLANNELEVEVSKDVEKEIEGIPVKISKGTKIKILKPGSKPPEAPVEETISEEEKKKKIEKLEKDPNLGVIG